MERDWLLGAAFHCTKMISINPNSPTALKGDASDGIKTHQVCLKKLRRIWKNMKCITLFSYESSWKKSVPMAKNLNCESLNKHYRVHYNWLLCSFTNKLKRFLDFFFWLFKTLTPSIFPCYLVKALFIFSSTRLCLFLRAFLFSMGTWDKGLEKNRRRKKILRQKWKSQWCFTCKGLEKHLHKEPLVSSRFFQKSKRWIGERLLESTNIACFLQHLPDTMAKWK